MADMSTKNVAVPPDLHDLSMNDVCKAPFSHDRQPCVTGHHHKVQETSCLFQYYDVITCHMHTSPSTIIIISQEARIKTFLILDTDDQLGLASHRESIAIPISSVLLSLLVVFRTTV